MDSLRKLYVELTTACNLNCQMCVRHTWQEIQGTMPLATFRRLMDQVREFPEPPIIHFGGYGEPMVHPDFLECVKLAKAIGARVQVTSNGTMLSRIVASALIDLGLDRLVISIDGVSENRYEDIRVGGSLPNIVQNLRDLWRLKVRRNGRHSNPQVGIAFVAMRSNVADMTLLPQLATHIGASDIAVSNVVPHTAEMEQEILYGRALRAPTYRASSQVLDLSLPKMDFNGSTSAALKGVFNSRASISLLDASLSGRDNYCQFAQEGYAVVRWDGAVSPCLSLMHDHPEYIRGQRKDVTHYVVGNINDQPLRAIWQSDEYAGFRQRLRDFPFSPCTTCGGCERFAGNYVDCSGEQFPTCGGCLWAQGFIQCP
jgi:MoaA/NifB/PqqE/SkfB family radical SAM enzyme